MAARELRSNADTAQNATFNSLSDQSIAGSVDDALLPMITTAHGWETVLGRKAEDFSFGILCFRNLLSLWALFYQCEGY